MPLIKRYSNRKLYDTESRRYVTLDELAQMIRQGENVEVVDHLTGIDLTAVTMAQIIFEQEKKLGGYLPQNVLARIIRSGTKSMRELQNSIQSFLEPNQFFEDELLRRLEILSLKKVISEEQSETLSKQLLSEEMRKDYDIDSGAEEGIVSLNDITVLISRIDELEKELDAIVDLRE